LFRSAVDGAADALVTPVELQARNVITPVLSYGRNCSGRGVIRHFRPLPRRGTRPVIDVENPSVTVHPRLPHGRKRLLVQLARLDALVAHRALRKRRYRRKKLLPRRFRLRTATVGGRSRRNAAFRFTPARWKLRWRFLPGYFVGPDARRRQRRQMSRSGGRGLFFRCRRDSFRPLRHHRRQIASFWMRFQVVVAEQS